MACMRTEIIRASISLQSIFTLEFTFKPSVCLSVVDQSCWYSLSSLSFFFSRVKGEGARDEEKGEPGSFVLFRLPTLCRHWWRERRKKKQRRRRRGCLARRIKEKEREKERKERERQHKRKEEEEGRFLSFFALFPRIHFHACSSSFSLSFSTFQFSPASFLLFFPSLFFFLSQAPSHPPLLFFFCRYLLLLPPLHSFSFSLFLLLSKTLQLFRASLLYAVVLIFLLLFGVFAFLFLSLDPLAHVTSLCVYGSVSVCLAVCVSTCVYRLYA